VTGHHPLTLPLPRDRAAEPPSCYRWLRRQRPVCRARMPSGDPAWLVTRYADARFVLSDRRFGKAALLDPDAPRIRPGTLPPGLLFTTDPPEHTALRRRMKGLLSRARLSAMRPVITAIVGDLLDGFAATDQADIVDDVARPLAMRVVCHLLGVPEADRDRFAGWAEAVLTVTGFRDEEVDAAQRALFAYTSAMVAARRAEPAGDLVSALVRDGEPEAADAAASLAATLLVTGYETMVAGLANSVLVLLTQGGMPAPWPAESGELVEELLRLGTFGDALRSRRAVTDVRVGDVLVPAGDVVLVSTASANRDEEVFAEPDRLLPGRGGPRHLAFGHGAHHCLGANLARIGLDAALERLAARLPGLRLAAAPEDIMLREGSAESPPRCLPVRWTATAAR
jgi:cytochrome P450